MLTKHLERFFTIIFNFQIESQTFQSLNTLSLTSYLYFKFHTFAKSKKLTGGAFYFIFDFN